MRSPDLMRDRHIDQLIMCSIYVVAKVTQYIHVYTQLYSVSIFSAGFTKRRHISGDHETV